MRTSNLWRALAIVAIAAGGCGFPAASPNPPVDDGRAWHLPQDLPPRRRGYSQKEYVRLRLPEARHGSRDDQASYREVPRMIVNLLPDGDIMFKGGKYPLANGTPEQIEASFAALRDEIQTLVDNPEWRDPQGRSRIRLMFHADRNVPWRYLPELVRVDLDPSILIHHHQWAVKGVGSWEDQRHGGTVESIPRGDTPENALPVRLEGRAVPGGTAVTLAVGPRRWSFGAGDTDYLDAAFVGRANAVWAEADAALERSRERFDRASLTLPEPAPGVTWGHVVATFDLLLGRGFRVIDLPVQGWRFTMEPPDLPAPQPPRDDPLVTPYAVAAVLLGLLLGALVTLRPRRARRRAAASDS